jgi:hypothetical protein
MAMENIKPKEIIVAEMEQAKMRERKGEPGGHRKQWCERNLQARSGTERLGSRNALSVRSLFSTHMLW